MQDKRDCTGVSLPPLRHHDVKHLLAVASSLRGVSLTEVTAAPLPLSALTVREAVRDCTLPLGSLTGDRDGHSQWPGTETSTDN